MSAVEHDEYDPEDIPFDLHQLTLDDRGPQQDLQIDLCDCICQRINQDWKRLGRTLKLTPEEVTMIELTEHQMHERAHTMLNSVKDKFGILTLDSVVEGLGQINRKDVIHDINYILEDNNSDNLYDLPTVNHGRNTHEDVMLVRNIDELALINIAKSLDSITTTNYVKLAHAFGFEQKVVDHLTRAYAGGGNPSEHFFKDLENKHPALTLADIQDFCVKIKRNDIDMFIRKAVESRPEIEYHTPLRDLRYDFHEDLVSKFAKSATMGGDWRGLAGHFRYRMSDITHIESRIKEENMSSPTLELFKILSCKFPDLSLQELRDKLESIRRMDVVGMVEQLIESHGGTTSRSAPTYNAHDFL